MKKLVTVTVLMALSQMSRAEIETYECQLSKYHEWVALTVDVKNKVLAWGGDELYDIRHNNTDYVTAYRREGTTDNVGGAIIVFDRKNLDFHYADVSLLVVDFPKDQHKYIARDHDLAKCRMK